MRKGLLIVLLVALSMLLVACPPVPDEDVAPRQLGTTPISTFV